MDFHFYVHLVEPEWLGLHSDLVTKQDLATAVTKIMATQAEVVAQLQAVQVTLNKVATEEASLVDKIAALQKIIDGMSDASPELVAAAQAVSDQAGVLDAIVPDVVPTP